MDIFYTILSVFGRGDALIVIALATFLWTNLRTKKYLLHLLLLLGTSSSLSMLSKMYFNIPRPLVKYGSEDLHTVPWLDQAFSNSFPSGHTIGAFSFFSFLVYAFPQLPNSIKLLCFMLAAGCGISRIYLAQHVMSDIISGTIIGFGIGFLIGKSYHRKKINQVA